MTISLWFSGDRMPNTSKLAARPRCFADNLWGRIAVSLIEKDLVISDLKVHISILKIDQDKSKWNNIISKYTSWFLVFYDRSSGVRY